jgi:hypothetical protein
MTFSLPSHGCSVQRAVTAFTERVCTQPFFYCLGVWVLITLLVLLWSGPVYAEWVKVAGNEHGDVTVYVNPDTMSRQDERVTMWVLFDFKTTQTVEGHLMLSVKGQEEYDCAGKRRRVRSFSEFSGNMEGGKEVKRSDESTWGPVGPESVVHTLWTVACGKK